MVRTRCRDCGTTAAMDWWVGRYKHPGSAANRCHACYLAYLRHRYDMKQAQLGRTVERKPRRSTPPPKPPASLTCLVCGQVFTRPSGMHPAHARCSPACRAAWSAATQRRKNSRRRGAKVGDQYTIADVVKRDGNKCHLCGKRVNMSLPGTDRMGPTVDHLLPIAAGGLDELANVRLAHRSCNCSRGAGGTVQLMAFG